MGAKNRKIRIYIYIERDVNMEEKSKKKFKNIYFESNACCSSEQQKNVLLLYENNHEQLKRQIEYASTREDSFFLIDNNGEVFKKTAKTLEDKGYKIIELNFLNPEHSDSIEIIKKSQTNHSAWLLARAMEEHETLLSCDIFMSMLFECMILYAKEKNMDFYEMCCYVQDVVNNEKELFSDIDITAPEFRKIKEFLSLNVASRWNAIFSLSTKLMECMKEEDKKVFSTKNNNVFLLGDIAKDNVAVFCIVPENSFNYEISKKIIYTALLANMFDLQNNSFAEMERC